MLSNVSKTADILRGNTQMQDLWLEVEKETAGWHPGRPPPKQIQSAIREGMALNEKERHDILERMATRRQQFHNNYVSDSAMKLTLAKWQGDKKERKEIQDRLTKRTVSCLEIKPKAPTQLGHVLMTGEHSPQSPVRQPKKTPKSRAVVSSPDTEGKTRTKKSGFAGLTMSDFQTKDWTPSFEYRPAKQDHPWKNVEGFSVSTRTLERRKMDPFCDINSFTGNAYSAKQTFSKGHVRPLDNKGQLGAGPVQAWKETLREDFANDNDNYSSNSHDAMLDALKAAMKSTSNFSQLQ